MPAAIEKEHLGSLRSAVQAFLVTSSDLVTLTAYNATTNLSIINTLGKDDLKAKSVNVLLLANRRVHTEVDGGPWTAEFDILCRHESEVSVLNMIGAIEALAEQNRTTNRDASYSTHAQVDLNSIIFVEHPGSEDDPLVTEAAQKGIKEAKCGLRVRWREK